MGEGVIGVKDGGLLPLQDGQIQFALLVIVVAQNVVKGGFGRADLGLVEFFTGIGDLYRFDQVIDVLKSLGWVFLQAFQNGLIDFLRYAAIVLGGADRLLSEVRPE